MAPVESAPLPLTRENFIAALQSADYLTFTGHGGNSFLRLNPDIMIKTEDIPTLDGIVISTVSCQTLRLWNDNSIARKIIDQGAAAYSGFVFSPNEGYVIGEFNELPFRYTWPDFPIGHVIQVQNRGTLQGFAHFPYNYLVGDPRIAFQSQPPYEIIDDHLEGESRIITLQDVPAGVIPIRVVGGAIYRFVEAQGITSASQGDLIYNSRLQMVNIDQDKYILLVYKGGNLTLQLHSSAPWYWFPIDFLLDALDYTLIFIQQTGGDFVAIGFSIIPLLGLGWQIRKKRINRINIRPALLIGLVMAILQGIYVFVRLPHIAITSKEVVFSPLGLLSAFLLGTCGALIFLQARSWIGKLAGIMVVTFTSWAVTLFQVLLIAAFNSLAFHPRYGTSLYNHSPGLLSAASFLVLFLVFGGMLILVSARANHKERIQA
jgi:hypothetical protein